MQALTQIAPRNPGDTSEGSPSRVFVRLAPSHEEMDIAPLAEFVRESAECGAVATFEGIVRLTENGQSLSGLQYEYHEKLAASELRKLCEEMLEEHQVQRVACVHKVGFVPVGQASVIIAVGAGHRGMAFRACEKVVDELKRRVPIWKAPVWKS